MHDVMAQRSINKMLRKMVGLLVLIVVLTLLAMFGVSLAAGEALKDSKVSGSVMTTLKGTPMQVDTVQSTKTLWHVGSASTNDLAKLKTITFYMDMTTDASTSGWVEATFQVWWRRRRRLAALSTIWSRVAERRRALPIAARASVA